MSALARNIIFTFLMASISKQNFGHPLPLGSASNFAAFTAIGAFENIGASMITGNIGTHAGKFNGFPPGELTGEKHIADAQSFQAAIDVNKAYNSMSDISCGIFIGNTMGNNQILTPNVYCLGAAEIKGDLILDGKGDANSLFFIKVEGALTAQSLSRIILINSASVSNVFWSINGTFVAEKNSIIKGTLLVHGAIRFLKGASLEGRALSCDGAISLFDNLVEIKKPTSNAKPVSLVAFHAEINELNTQVFLIWETAAELDCDNSLVEKSIDGVHFEPIGKICAASVGDQLHSYCFTDRSPKQGFNYYRLNQFDLKGLHEYSAIKAVEFNHHEFSVTLFPNPFASSIEIVNNEFPENKTMELRIYDAIGKPMLTRIITKKITTLNTADFPSGAYMYVVIVNQNVIQTGNLVAL